MSKEIYISSTPHETRLAIVESDELTEIYYERENEYSLAGSIYNGRVTRVLPGMQSSFVDIGLERDAFLYITDFMEDEADTAEFDHTATQHRDRRVWKDREATVAATATGNEAIATETLDASRGEAARLLRSVPKHMSRREIRSRRARLPLPIWLGPVKDVARSSVGAAAGTDVGVGVVIVVRVASFRVGQTVHRMANQAPALSRLLQYLSRQRAALKKASWCSRLVLANQQSTKVPSWVRAPRVLMEFAGGADVVGVVADAERVKVPPIQRLRERRAHLKAQGRRSPPLRSASRP